MKKIEWCHRSTGGFTIIEILAVIAVISILFATLGIAVGKARQQIKIRAAQSEMENVRAGLDEYYENYGGYPLRNIPSTGQTRGLVTALYEYYECKFSYSMDLYWIDPWSTEYEYRLVDGGPVLRSCGPDSIVDNNDDLITR